MRKFFLTYGDKKFNIAKKHLSLLAKESGFFDEVIALGPSDLDKELPPGTDDDGNTSEYLNAIKWSRFGNFAITKWSGSDWIE